MKYYRILNPADLKPGEEDDSVFLGWKEIIDPCLELLIEENIDFLYYLLINLPFVEEDGKIAEKTVLMAQPIPELEFCNSDIQISISDDLKICYNL